MWTTLVTAVVSAALGMAWGARHPKEPLCDLCEAVSDSVKTLVSKCKKRKNEDEGQAVHTD